MLYAGLPTLAFKRFLNTSTKPPSNLQQYVESMTSCASTFPQALIESLEAETRKQFEDAFKMVSIHQAHLIYNLTRMIRPQNVLEIGTFTGMSTLSIAAGTDGNILSIDRDAKPINIARMWLEQAKVADRVIIEEGIALDIIKKLPTGAFAPKFDLVFIDADKGNYINYFNQIMSRSLLSDRGIILVDNVLFRGLVPNAMENNFDPKDKNLIRTARKLHAFNQHVKDDPRVEQIILPLFDGLSIIQRKPKLSCVLPQG
ncbi:hypothetical protein INT43_006057 [Umbelopsis isabellina]|uniref:O-methyltransferase n=1 Tax=Mortierella isabellina TaxID=91625 RepID=A0A8H7U9T9_MORIS|nr:hypothetical protein INT43_006057 [Umbelopsis isabellina]